MIRYTHQSLDEACETLRKIAVAMGCRVELTVWGDGEVTIAGEDGVYTRWKLRAHLDEGSKPSAKLCDLPNASQAREEKTK